MTIEYQLTPWFDTEVDGPPRRKGLYEGSAIGIPGNGNTYQHGYYYWDGEKWSGWGSSPEQIMSGLAFRARHWRGVIPGKGYPYDQVKIYQPSHFTGNLEPVGTAVGCVNIHRLEITDKHLSIQLMMESASRESEKYQCTLIEQGGEFTGKAKARIRNFTLDVDTHFRAVLSAKTNDGFSMTLNLKMPTKQWQQFQGVLKKTSTP